VVEFDPPSAAASLLSVPIAGAVDQHPPHGLGGGGEEVPAALKPLFTDQPQVRFVDQGRGVVGMTGGLSRHARGGERPQLVVHEREQVGGGLAVAGLGGFEEASHVGHERECNRRPMSGKAKGGCGSAAPPDGYDGRADGRGGQGEAMEGMVKMMPIGRGGRADEIADAVVWLCSDWASYVVGQSLSVDGGFTMR
jgi:hypothetical protein